MATEVGSISYQACTAIVTRIPVNAIVLNMIVKVAYKGHIRSNSLASKVETNSKKSSSFVGFASGWWSFFKHSADFETIHLNNNHRWDNLKDQNWVVSVECEPSRHHSCNRHGQRHQETQAHQDQIQCLVSL